MTRRVEFSPSAQQQLSDLYHWITDRSGFPDRSADYISAIIDFCENLANFPMVGRARDDLRPGLRTIGFRRRVVIAFAVDSMTVRILGVFYGGQDYEHMLAVDEG